jgi:hypothetical protein
LGLINRLDIERLGYRNRTSQENKTKQYAKWHME